MLVCRLTDVERVYPLGDLSVHALCNVNLTINRGEFTVLAGPSGSGKTTLLNIIGLIDNPSSGRRFINDNDTALLSATALDILRAKEIGFVFQKFHLIPVLTAFENVDLALQLSGQRDRSERKEKVEQALREVGLEDYQHRLPKQLSGGQQQRVSIARALVKRPQLIIADEPTANLDSQNGNQILDLMTHLNDQYGTTFVFSSHDQLVISRARRVIRLLDGKIVNIAT